jgi:hypothetical protein
MEPCVAVSKEGLTSLYLEDLICAASMRGSDTSLKWYSSVAQESKTLDNIWPESFVVAFGLDNNWSVDLD